MISVVNNLDMAELNNKLDKKLNHLDKERTVNLCTILLSGIGILVLTFSMFFVDSLQTNYTALFESIIACLILFGIFTFAISMGAYRLAQMNLGLRKNGYNYLIAYNLNYIPYNVAHFLTLPLGNNLELIRINNKSITVKCDDEEVDITVDKLDISSSRDMSKLSFILNDNGVIFSN